MRLNKEIFLLFAFLYFFTSCSKQDDYSILDTQVGKFVVPLDSTMSFKSRTIQFIDNYLLVLNELKNTIHQFEYPSGRPIEKMNFEYSGENGVGKIVSFLLHNKDSLFLLNSQRQVLLLNNKHFVEWRIPTINLSAISVFPDPIQTRTTSPMVYFEHKIFLNGMIGGMKNILPVPYADLEDKKAYNTYKYPDIEAYTDNLRIEVYYYLYSHTYNTKENYFVYSFPADDSLRITDFGQIDFAKHAKSSNLGEINPYLEQEKEYADDEYLLVHLAKNYYGGVLYDKYRNLYYRFFTKNVKPADYEKSNTKDDFYLRENGVLVFDRNFEKIAEFLLPIAVYDINNLFVSPDGLAILNQKKCIENEDSLYYDIFKLH